jgi:threonine dehydrogenase-like Zn-dependent dehydrogenase
VADVVFEATGNSACTRMTTTLVGHGGRIVLIGWNRGPVEIDTVTLMRKEVDVLGSRCSLNAFGAVIQLLDQNVINAGAMVTHRFGLQEAGAALDVLDKGRGITLKVLIEQCA